MNKLLRNLALAAVAAGLSAPAWALPELALSSNGTTWTVVAIDNTLNDSSPTTGEVLWSGSFGGFNLQVHTGTTFPAIGSLTNPELDLAFKANAMAAGDLYIAFSADGFGPTHGTPVAAIGGTAASGTTIWFNTYGGNSNTLLDLSVQRTGLGPFTGAFSGTTTGMPINAVGPYSLTEVVHLSATRGGLSSGDADLKVPDSGTTLMLLGAGLSGLILFARVRKQFA